MNKDTVTNPPESRTTNKSSISQEKLTEQVGPIITEGQQLIPKANRKGCCTVPPLVVLLAIFILWTMVKPGVFTVQPIGALPDGVTFIYHSRNSNMPFFSSPDGLCLKLQGEVNLMCRGIALSSSTDLAGRIIIRLPYSHWAYLKSTGGLEFDR
jgi:hypothetical protein